MPGVLLILADYDEPYIDRLEKRLQLLSEGRYRICVFTRPGALTEFVQKNKPVHGILLIGRSMYEEGGGSFDVEIPVILTDDGDNEPVDGKPSIGRYQPADAIYKALTDIASQNGLYHGGLVREGKHTAVIAVYSPVGGSGKSLLALSLTAYFAAAGVKTLFLDFEAMNSSRLVLHGREEGPGLSALLYYLREDRKNFLVRLDTMKKRDPSAGFFYFEPFDSPPDMDEMTPRDVEAFISDIRRLGQHERVVIDTGSELTARCMALLQQCDLELLVHVPGLFSESKFRLYDREMKRLASVTGVNPYDNVGLVLNKHTAGPAGLDFLPGQVLAEACRIPVLEQPGGAACESWAGIAGKMAECVFPYAAERLNNLLSV